MTSTFSPWFPMALAAPPPKSILSICFLLMDRTHFTRISIRNNVIQESNQCCVTGIPNIDNDRFHTPGRNNPSSYFVGLLQAWSTDLDFGANDPLDSRSSPKLPRIVLPQHSLRWKEQIKVKRRDRGVTCVLRKKHDTCVSSSSEEGDEEFLHKFACWIAFCSGETLALPLSPALPIK